MENETLGTALPKEMARVRDEVLAVYETLPNESAWFAKATIRQTLDEAAKAMMEGDVVAMLRAYVELQKIELS